MVSGKWRVKIAIIILCVLSAAGVCEVRTGVAAE